MVFAGAPDKPVCKKSFLVGLGKRPIKINFLFQRVIGSNSRKECAIFACGGFPAVPIISGLLLHVLHALTEDGADVIVGEGIKDGFAVAAEFDQLRLF